MKDAQPKTTRRNLIKHSLTGIAAAAVTSEYLQSTANAQCCSSAAGGNAQFYNSDGSFNQEIAKQAYYKMMKAFNYPIQDILKTDAFWVCDFLQNDFSKLGMAGIFWTNTSGVYGETGAKAYHGSFQDKKFGYLGHEIYLLPGQMLPEHRHIGGTEGHGPKMEGWHVRYGSVEFFGEYQGEGNETLIKDMSKAERPWGHDQDWFKSKYIAKRTYQSGQMYTLQDPESWHSQRAGVQGAIVSEYATYHNHVEFSKPGLAFDNSKAT